MGILCNISTTVCTYRSRGLSAKGFNAVDLASKVALHSVQLKPIDVGSGVGGGRNISSLRSNNESIWVPLLTGRAEIPLRTQARASDGVRDEEVLTERNGELDEGEGFNEARSSDLLGSKFPSVEREFADGIESGRVKTGDVEKFSNGTNRAIIMA